MSTPYHPPGIARRPTGELITPGTTHIDWRLQEGSFRAGSYAEKLWKMIEAGAEPTLEEISHHLYGDTTYPHMQTCQTHIHAVRKRLFKEGIFFYMEKINPREPGRYRLYRQGDKALEIAGKRGQSIKSSFLTILKIQKMMEDDLIPHDREHMIALKRLLLIINKFIIDSDLEALEGETKKTLHSPPDADTHD